MKRNRELDYRITDADFQSFMRRSGEISSDDQLADADIDPSVDADTGNLIDAMMVAMNDDAPATALADAEAVAAPSETVVPSADIVDDLLADLNLAPDDGITDDELIEAIEAKCEEAPPSAVAPATAPAIPKYGAMAEANKIGREKRKGRNRKRLQRANAKSRKTEPNGRRLKALLRATARSGNNFLVQLRGREQKLVNFRSAMGLAVHKHGLKASHQQIADVYAEWEPGFTRDQARRWRETVIGLEADGGPWHNL